MISKKLFCFLFLQFIGIGFYFSQNWTAEQLQVTTANTLNKIMDADALFEDRWIELSQPQFWKQIMLMSPDSCLINVSKDRQILEKIALQEWNRKSEIQKENYKNELRVKFGLSSTEKLFVTIGKNDFYRFHEVYTSLGKGIQAFEKNKVDPWYAQSILLIESPARMQKSISGAYGPFQLMPGIAKKYGLTVTATIDERENFERSAFAASQLIKSTCIPSAKSILNKYGIAYQESDLWFRLFVMHIYHAGAQNVAAVVAKINPSQGSKELIQAMWITSAASFGNNSQNYSQLALAAQWLLHDYVYQHCDDIHPCSMK